MKIEYDVLDWIEAIPDCKKRGKEYKAPCPCGGTIIAIRSTYNGHLCARCEACKMFVIE